MAKIGIANITSDPGVKAHVKDLLKEVGVVYAPATAATPAMMRELVGSDGVLAQERSDRFLRHRDEVQAVFEGVGG